MSAGLRFSQFIGTLIFLIAGCGQPEQPGSQGHNFDKGKPLVVVTSQPLLNMAKAVAGDAADVQLVVPANTLSRRWSPTADDVRVMQQAQLILISGAGYEPWKSHVSLPGSRLRDTAAGYYDQFIRIPDAVTHQHGPDGSHSHPGTVWATWLDPELCAAQLHAVAANCGRLMPERTKDIAAAEARMAAEIETLSLTLTSIKKSRSNNGIKIFSDAPHYQYLIQRLGWSLHYLHWGEAETLSDAEKSELLDAFKAADSTGDPDGGNARIFLMDSRRSADVEDFVRVAGGVVVRIDLCETPDVESGTLVARMKSNLLRLQDVLKILKNP